MIRVFVSLVLVASIACAADPRKADPYPGFVNASPEERAAVVRIVDDYFAKRTEAAATRDTTALFAAYPSLARGGDRETGVNADIFLPERMRVSAIREIAVELEDRAPIRVLVRGDAALAFVHGKETWHYERGGPGMGEFYTQVDLRRAAGGWTIERTDEVMLPEWPPRTPRP